MNSMLNEYFKAINNRAVAYKDLKKSMKQAWLNYKHKPLKKTPIDLEKIVDIIDSVFDEQFNIVDKQIEGGNTLSNYDAYTSVLGVSSEVSGNIDARKIRELSAKYGFDIPEAVKCDDLLKIKGNRNKLSHGEESFSNIGKEAIEDLMRMKIEVVNYLNLVIRHVESCKRGKSYLA